MNVCVCVCVCERVAYAKEKNKDEYRCASQSVLYKESVLQRIACVCVCVFLSLHTSLLNRVGYFARINVHVKVKWCFIKRVLSVTMAVT